MVFWLEVFFLGSVHVNMYIDFSKIFLGPTQQLKAILFFKNGYFKSDYLFWLIFQVETFLD